MILRWLGRDPEVSIWGEKWCNAVLSTVALIKALLAKAVPSKIRKPGKRDYHCCFGKSCAPPLSMRLWFLHTGSHSLNTRAPFCVGDVKFSLRNAFLHRRLSSFIIASVHFMHAWFASVLHAESLAQPATISLHFGFFHIAIYYSKDGACYVAH